MSNIDKAFKDKILVITGGTGSFGSTVLRHFLSSDIAEIRIISRDEKKQDWMRHTLQAHYPEYAGKVQFYIGDVRNIDSVRDVMYGANYVFHAAALKEVPSCEFFPMEAVKTNIIGTDNVISAAVENKVERVVFLSTDKAAYPINEIQRLEEIVMDTAKAYQCTADIEYKEVLPVAYNTPEMTKIAHKAAAAIVGEENCVTAVPTLASEDFAIIMDRIPSYLYWVGSGTEGEPLYAWHNPRFHANDTALPVAAAVYASSAVTANQL